MKIIIIKAFKMFSVKGFLLLIIRFTFRFGEHDVHYNERRVLSKDYMNKRKSRFNPAFIAFKAD